MIVVEKTDGEWTKDAHTESPLHGMDFEQMRLHMLKIEAKYPEYKNFKYEQEYSYSKGEYWTWWELKAECRTELLKALE